MTTFEMAFWLTFILITAGALVCAVVERVTWWDAWIAAQLGEGE